MKSLAGKKGNLKKSGPISLRVIINPTYNPCDRPGQFLEFRISVRNKDDETIEREIVNRLNYTIVDP